MQDQIIARSRGAGVQPEVVRLASGLTPLYVPPIPPRGSVRCAACGHTYDGRGAVTAARECADFDNGTTD